MESNENLAHASSGQLGSDNTETITGLTIPFEDIQAAAIEANKLISDRLNKINAIKDEIEIKLVGLSPAEIETLFDRIDSNVRKKSVFEPGLFDEPVIHGYRTP